MQKKFSKKIIETLGEAKELVEKILRWRQMKLDEVLRVKYEPHKQASRSHFEAIMADVNEPQKQVEEAMRLFEISEGLASELPLMDTLYEMEISDEEKAEIEYKKKLKQQREIQAHLDFKNKR